MDDFYGSFHLILIKLQVKSMLELLWKNEARLCSFISDIQDQGFGKKAGHSMFFLENIFVPPIKFRPPTKGGDNVSMTKKSCLSGSYVTLL